jgi:hypothetical protein
MGVSEMWGYPRFANGLHGDIRGDMTFYRVHFQCKECSVGYPTKVLLRRPENNLAARSVEEVFGDYENPASIEELLSQESFQCWKGHTSRNLTTQDLFLEIAQ